MDSHNMSWIQYPSHVSPDVEDVIAAQNVISRCMHVYIALFVPLSLVIGLFNLITFIRGRSRLGSLDMLLSGLTVTSVLATLLSFSVASRPDYILTTNLHCGILSFFSNMCYFNAQHLQGAMLVLSVWPGSSRYLLTGAQGLWKPMAGLAAIWGCAVCSSLVVVALLGTSRELTKITMCQADPLTAWPEYEIVKFSLGFGFTLVLKLVLFFLLTAKPAWRTALTQSDTASARWVVLAVTLNMFASRLFYNTALLQRARRKMERDVGSPGDELIMNLAELVLSGESCVNSLATLILHKPCRLMLLDTLGCLTQRCRREGTDNSVSLNRMGAGSDPDFWHEPQAK